MIKWKYKGKHYYFDHVPALGIIAFLFGAPMLVAWSENHYINYLSPWNIIPVALAIYLIYLNCINSYKPYYFDKSGKKIIGEESKD